MFCSGYSVSLCCCMYCLCVNVYCTTAIGCQPNCSEQNISISKCQISTTAIPSSLSDAIPHPYIFHVLKSILISSHSLRVCVCCNSPKSPPPKKFRVRILPLSHACFIPSPYDSTWFNQPNDIQRRASSSLSSTNIFLSTLRLSSAHFVSYQAPHQYKKTQNFHFYASLFYFAPFLSSKKKDRISLKEWKLANRVCLSVNFLLCIT